jgi:hypothetical protein
LHEDTFKTETDFVFTTPLGSVDLIGEFTGVGRYEHAIEGAITVELDDLPVQVLSMPKLMAAKESTGRTKDLLVYHELEVVKTARECLDNYAMERRGVENGCAAAADQLEQS